MKHKPAQETVFTVIGAQINIAHGLQWAFKKVLVAARRLVNKPTKSLYNNDTG